ncbi:MAG: metallophosphoesterase family protein, partial [Planctomycetaceae bacterium]|nr:metallophosphoesterase family protein [Planctomycetaceae bacterium]
MKLLVYLVAAIGCTSLRTAWCDVLVHPYLQNPSSTAMSVYWVTDTDEPGELSINSTDGTELLTFTSDPVQKAELNYGPSELSLLPGGKAPDLPYVHNVRVDGLQPGTTYIYTLTQGKSKFSRRLHTAPEAEGSVRFIVYADSETEPESTGNLVDWPAPFAGKKKRPYVVDQTEGYKQNLKMIQSREPDFIAIAGDLVEKGGRQLDWDEFWRHNAGEFSDIAGSIPILAAVGNHENFAGSDGGYSVAGARRAIDKFQTYFEAPDNGSGNTAFQDRYYRIDYGPITWITLDCTNGLPDKSAADTNFMLLGEGEGGDAPDFNPGSTQYQWLEKQLADAQSTSQFTFVTLHHMPFSVGPHGLPAGDSDGEDTQSGQPVRVLSPLFEK